MKRIEEVALNAGIENTELYKFGDYIAKVNISLLERMRNRKDGNLILVTAMTPTQFGEGKTTTAIGLSDALNDMGYKAMCVLREPSLGPVFGVKGGATGGGRAQVVPMEEINLQFTGDIPSVQIAHNLLAALIDNHLEQGNPLGIDSRRVVLRRSLDMNDRALRDIVIGLGGKANGVPRETGFDITAASEVMAILGLSSGIDDLKDRLSRMLVGFTYSGNPVYAKDVKAQGAMAAVLINNINPNLVQSLEGHPVFVHCGPFANIAYGSASITSIKMAMKLADYVVVEAGFGSDLGGEKFMDIVSRAGNFKPAGVVIVATLRALKLHGGIDKDKIMEENIEGVLHGVPNLEKHYENMKSFSVPVVVVLNKFKGDSQLEIDALRNYFGEKGIRFAISEAYESGGEGTMELADAVIRAIKEDSNEFHYLYNLDEPLKDKIKCISQNMYGATGIKYTKEAETDLRLIDKLGLSNSYVCMAKTQLSLSDDTKKLGRPKNYDITVKEVRILNGAGFVVPICGEIMTMPGLPKIPAAELIDVKDGKIVGLF